MIIVIVIVLILIIIDGDRVRSPGRRIHSSVPQEFKDLGQHCFDQQHLFYHHYHHNNQPTSFIITL